MYAFPIVIFRASGAGYQSQSINSEYCIARCLCWPVQNLLSVAQFLLFPSLACFKKPRRATLIVVARDGFFDQAVELCGLSC